MINFFKKILIHSIINLLPKYNLFDKARGFFFILLGVKAGKNFKVGSNVLIFSPEKLIVEDNCYIGVMSYLGNGYIKIGNNVLIGNHVSILPSNHSSKGSDNFRFGEIDQKQINISDDCWICAQSIITAGVTISEKTLVAAGTKVLRSNKDDKFIKNIYK